MSDPGVNEAWLEAVEETMSLAWIRLLCFFFFFFWPFPTIGGKRYFKPVISIVIQ